METLVSSPIETVFQNQERLKLRWYLDSECFFPLAECSKLSSLTQPSPEVPVAQRERSLSPPPRPPPPRPLRPPRITSHSSLKHTQDFRRRGLQTKRHSVMCFPERASRGRGAGTLLKSRPHSYGKSAPARKVRLRRRRTALLLEITGEVFQLLSPSLSLPIFFSNFIISFYGDHYFKCPFGCIHLQ